jgi:hypothetical protein
MQSRIALALIRGSFCSRKDASVSGAFAPAPATDFSRAAEGNGLLKRGRSPGVVLGENVVFLENRNVFDSDRSGNVLVRWSK